MKNLSIVFLVFILFGFTINKAKLDGIIGETFEVQINDSTQIKINQLLSKTTNLPIYYYSDLYIHACNTGECKMIDLKMFWDIYGNYFKYEVKNEVPLTKYDHKVFKSKEYIKLHLLLCDTASDFKTISFDKLTEKQADKKFKTDAKSGATIKLFSSNNNIKGAIKTSHTLWNVANGKELQQKIIKQTEKLVSKKGKAFNDEKIQWQNFNKLDLTQVAFLLKKIKNTEDSKEILEKTFEKDVSDDKNMLVSNYFFRTKISCKKANKYAKKYPFVK